MFQKKEKRFLEFVTLVSKLEAAEYCGLCKILGVSLLQGEEPRTFEESLGELMDKFLGMKKKPRRQLMEMLRAAAQKEAGESDGTST